MKLPACCLIAALAVTSTAQAAPAMWEVRDDDSSIWLFGSFHILPEGAAWRSELFDAVMADADKVVFETDVRPAAVTQMGVEGFVRGIYDDGTLLTDILDDSAEALLREAAAVINLPVGPILAMRPWLATNTISGQAMAAAGYSAEGVEFVLQPELANTRIGFLESGEEQLDVLTNASEDEQVAMLVSTLEQIPALPKVMDKMISRWLKGTPEKLNQLLEMDMGGFDEAFLDRLLYARNQNWIPPLEAMLADNAQNLVIVGAAHLIGDGSVIELLEQAGYEVERIQ